MDQPFKQFISGILDLTIIKPLIEISTGTEMITNEDLIDTDKLYKGIGAIIDILTLGYDRGHFGCCISIGTDAIALESDFHRIITHIKN